MEIRKILKLFTRVTTVFVILVTGLLLALGLYLASPSIFYSASRPTTGPWKPKNIDTDVPKGKKGQLIKYGHLLISETPKWIGPMVKDSEMMYAGNNLACKNCHLKNGTQAGSASPIAIHSSVVVKIK